MKRRRLVCGNPYSFQGDEQPHYDSVARCGQQRKNLAPTKAADERRFNVAASRARDKMILFHSVTRDDLGPTLVLGEGF